MDLKRGARGDGGPARDRTIVRLAARLGLGAASTVLVAAGLGAVGWASGAAAATGAPTAPEAQQLSVTLPGVGTVSLAVDAATGTVGSITVLPAGGLLAGPVTTTEEGVQVVLDAASGAPAKVVQVEVDQHGAGLEVTAEVGLPDASSSSGEGKGGDLGGSASGGAASTGPGEASGKSASTSEGEPSDSVSSDHPGSTEPTEPPDSTEPTDTTEPPDSTEPTDTTEPPDSTEPTDAPEGADHPDHEDAGDSGTTGASSGPAPAGSSSSTASSGSGSSEG
jgi:hypothetical protein